MSHLRATGQSAASARANINLTPEKRTRIHEVIVNKRSAQRVVSPNFNVSVGACAAYHAVRSSSWTIVEIVFSLDGTM